MIKKTYDYVLTITQKGDSVGERIAKGLVSNVGTVAGLAHPALGAVVDVATSIGLSLKSGGDTTLVINLNSLFEKFKNEIEEYRDHAIGKNNVEIIKSDLRGTKKTLLDAVISTSELSRTIYVNDAIGKLQDIKSKFQIKSSEK